MGSGRRLLRVWLIGAVVGAIAIGCVETPSIPSTGQNTGLVSPTPAATPGQTSAAPASSATPATPTPTVAPTPSPSTLAPPTGPTLATVLAGLPVAAERRVGYRRQLFRLWVDADGNGCDTRKEVLIAEAILPADVSSTCTITGGEWFSPYDDLTFTDASKLDIDHMVPLAEAWDSGAFAWTPARRKAFANDLGVSWALIAVSAAANRSKGDKDPAEWLPPSVGYRCTYLAIWVAIKARWDLAVDSAEKSAIAAETECLDTLVPGP